MVDKSAVAASAAVEVATSFEESRLPVGELTGSTILAHGTRPLRDILWLARDTAAVDAVVVGEDGTFSVLLMIVPSPSSLTGGTVTPRLFVIIAVGGGVGSASSRREKE